MERKWSIDHERVWREAERQLATMGTDPYVGWCPGCQETRCRSECRQAVRDELCVYACLVCDHTVSDEIPF